MSRTLDRADFWSRLARASELYRAGREDAFDDLIVELDDRIQLVITREDDEADVAKIFDRHPESGAEFQDVLKAVRARRRAAEEAERQRRLAAAEQLVKAVLDSNRPQASWRNVEEWTEQDFVDRVRRDQEEGGTGGYRSVARRCEGWGATALLRRWKRVSGEKPWPSGQNAPLHRL